MSSIAGTVAMNVNFSVGLAATGNVLTAYSVPVSPQQTHSYTAGTGAAQINKVAGLGGSAAASPASIDLTAVVCADGTTGLSHVRELIVYNDSTTNVLTWDFTVSNALTAMFSAGGTSAKVSVNPGAHQRFNVPLGTNGYVVDSTHKIISLDPGANTIAYRIVLAGD